MIKKYRFLLFYIFLSCLATLSAQQIEFKSITVENGLSNNFVRTIYKDKVGFVWLGTLEGLDRFDGVEIKSYSKKAMGNRESVISLCEDENNTFWVGTENGLFRFDRKNEKSRKIKLDSIPLKIQTLAASSDKHIYIGTNRGLYIYDDRNLKTQHITFSENPYDNSNNLTGITEDPNKNMWISTNQGLVLYLPSGNRKEHYYYNNINKSASSNSFTGIVRIGSTLYLTAKSRELLSYDLQKRTFSSLGVVSNNYLLTIKTDGRNRIFIGTDGDGLKTFFIPTKSLETIYHDVNDPASISSNSVYSFLYDKGVFWIGTFSAGFNYGSSLQKRFRNFSIFPKSSFQNVGIRSVFISPDGDKFIGTRDGFLYLPEKKKPSLYKTKESPLRSNIILTIFPYKDKILLGTYGGGINVFDKNSGKLSDFSEFEDFIKGCVYGFATDKNGFLWIATLNGLYKYSDSKTPPEHFTTVNSGLVSNEIFSIKIDSKGRIWIGTMNGFGIFNHNTKRFALFRIPNQENIYRTTYIYEDIKNSIWLCTEKGGLFNINSNLEKISHYTTTDGIPDNSVCSVMEDDNGKYWISTLKGFGHFSATSRLFRSYGLSDGLPSLAFNPGAVFRTTSGELWWGNEKGLIYFHPDSIKDRIFSPVIKITGFYLSGKEIEPGEESALKSSIETINRIVLENRQSNIGFRFTALNYINPLDNHYSCILEGYDKEWKQVGNKNEVYYEKLPSGTYTFKVKSTDAEKPDSFTELTIVVRPPFYLFIYFFIGILTILGTLIWVRTVYNQKKKEAFRMIVQARAEFQSQTRQLSLQDKYKSSKIPEETGIIIRDALLSYMNEKKPYLNPDLKLADLAKEINYSVHEISQILNQYQNQHFSDFVNTYRVEEIKKRISDETYSKFTLTAIAQQCGFNSKTSFFRVFKKITGKTPADFFKESKTLLND